MNLMELKYGFTHKYILQISNKSILWSIFFGSAHYRLFLIHIIITFNNHCWCYTFDNKLLFGYQFISEIENIKFNEINIIKSYVFNIKNKQISYFTLTLLFLICNTKNGILYQIYLKNYKLINATKYKNEIKSIYPNENGTQNIFIDESNNGYLYNPITDIKLKLIN